MAMIDNATRAPFGAITIHRLATAMYSVVEAYQTWQTQRATVRALSNLTAAQLADIGLETADIQRYAAGGKLR